MRYLKFVLALGIALAPAPQAGVALAAASSDIKSSSDAANSVDVGAITFAVETPRHTQYLVAKIVFRFDEESEAERFRDARHIVWLRDMVLTGVRDARPNYVTADVDVDVLRGRIEKMVVAEVPTLKELDIWLLGRRNVPRR